MSQASNPSRRVVVTGVGAICSIGKNADQFWKNCLKGVSNVKRIPQHWYEYSTFDSEFWCPLPVVCALDSEFTRVQKLILDPSARLAILATKEALENAGYPVYKNSKGGYGVSDDNHDQFGVFMGTGVGGISSLLQNHTFPVLSRSSKEIDDLKEVGLSDKVSNTLRKIRNRMVFPRRVNPYIVSMLMPNAISANVGLQFGFTGPNTTFTVACAAGTVAIGNAFRAVKAGFVDVAIAGGAEYLDDEYGYIFRGFDVAGTLAKGESAESINRPFDITSNGFLLSQGGAASLVLEELESAISRDVPIIAEIVGYGESFDAHNIMQIGQDTSQIERMIHSTISGAGLTIGDIDYINAHGTGTVNNDEIETGVLSKIFSNYPIVNSTKALTGHSIGASGALEALVTVKSLAHQKTHVCKNLKNPIANLNFAKNIDSFKIKHALSQSFAFGGHNSAVAFSKFVA